jgi:hypothetical protein
MDILYNVKLNNGESDFSITGKPRVNRGAIICVYTRGNNKKWALFQKPMISIKK